MFTANIKRHIIAIGILCVRERHTPACVGCASVYVAKKDQPAWAADSSGNVTGVSSKHTESLLHAQLMKSIETAHLCLTAATRQQQQQQPMAKSIERDAFSALPSHKSA